MSEKTSRPGWKINSLLSLADYHNGAAFNHSDWGEEGIPIIRIEQINDPSAPTDFYGGPLLPQNRITTGDLVFSWSATLKAMIWKNGDGALNQHLFKVVPQSGTDKAFLHYLLEGNMDRISFGSQGSTMKHITRKELQRFRVEIPIEETEQRRIAEILGTVDAVIEQTEALIAKQQQMKAGLMHDLFTRGLTPTGELRPAHEQAPQLYKESPLGWIPKKWDVENLGKLAEIVSGVTLSSKTEPTQDIDVPYLRVANVQDGYLDLSEIKTVRVSATQLEKLNLLSGDVLMNEGGDFDKLGRGTVWNEEIVPCVHQNHVFRVRARTVRLLSYYLAFWSQSEQGKKYFLLNSKQSTNLASINSTQLHRFPIAVPGIDEQREIQKRIVSLNEVIAGLADEAAKLRQLKQGLMQDLLTGRVRVKAD